MAMTTARDLFESLGPDLVGRKVLTVQYGTWPGGVATVTEVEPDPAATEILFIVEMGGEEIGVFDFEPCSLVEEVNCEEENREPRREPDESQWAFRARKEAWQRKHGGPEPEDLVKP
jgi:hypothetical protein